MQRRFVRFTSGSVEEKVEEIFAAAFERLLDKVSLAMMPPYALAGPLDSAIYQDQDQAAADSTGAEDKKIYPPVEVAGFLIKVLRNSVGCCPDISSLESKVVRAMREYISSRMKPLGKSLERIYSSRRSVLTAQDTLVVEQMLNLGHSALAAVFAQWQVRYTLVGTPDATAAAAPGVPVKYVKDFLLPVRLSTPSAVLESIPKSLRDECKFRVEESGRRLKPSERLQAVALVAHAVRDSAASDYRALITYDATLDELPTSRDAVFIGLSLPPTFFLSLTFFLYLSHIVTPLIYFFVLQRCSLLSSWRGLWPPPSTCPGCTKTCWPAAPWRRPSALASLGRLAQKPTDRR